MKGLPFFTENFVLGKAMPHRRDQVPNSSHPVRPSCNLSLLTNKLDELKIF